MSQGSAGGNYRNNLPGKRSTFNLKMSANGASDYTPQLFGMQNEPRGQLVNIPSTETPTPIAERPIGFHVNKLITGQIIQNFFGTYLEDELSEAEKALAYQLQVILKENDWQDKMKIFFQGPWYRVDSITNRLPPRD